MRTTGTPGLENKTRPAYAVTEVRRAGPEVRRAGPVLWTRRAVTAWLVLSTTAIAIAQQPDPRVGLKPGFRDAGQAVRNLELVATLPKPDGFFDPTAPAGIPTPAEQPAATEKPAGN